MLKEFFDYFLKIGNVRQEQIGEQIFTTQPVHLIKQPIPSELKVRNLSGIVDYLTTNFDNQPPVLIHVASPTNVSVYSTFNKNMIRNHLIEAEALLPSIPFKQYLDLESFNVLLQSCFVVNEDRAKVLSVIGNVQEENVTKTSDDGVSQKVTAKTGIATLGEVNVPNPVKLKPYRSFVEITQPESEFIFRMRTGPEAALFEADGGAWKIVAIQDIKKYLIDNLASQIKEKKVTIIA